MCSTAMRKANNQWIAKKGARKKADCHLMQKKKRIEEILFVKIRYISAKLYYNDKRSTDFVYVMLIEQWNNN